MWGVGAASDIRISVLGDGLESCGHSAVSRYAGCRCGAPSSSQSTRCSEIEDLGCRSKCHVRTIGNIPESTSE